MVRLLAIVLLVGGLCAECHATTLMSLFRQARAARIAGNCGKAVRLYRLALKLALPKDHPDIRKQISECRGVLVRSYIHRGHLMRTLGRCKRAQRLYQRALRNGRGRGALSGKVKKWLARCGPGPKHPAPRKPASPRDQLYRNAHHAAKRGACKIAGKYYSDALRLDYRNPLFLPQQHQVLVAHYRRACMLRKTSNPNQPHRENRLEYDFLKKHLRLALMNKKCSLILRLVAAALPIAPLNDRATLKRNAASCQRHNCDAWGRVNNFHSGLTPLKLNNGDVVVVSDGPTPNRWTDIKLLRIRPDGRIVWTARFGGKHLDRLHGAALNGRGEILVWGRTRSFGVARPTLVAARFSTAGKLLGFKLLPAVPDFRKLFVLGGGRRLESLVSNRGFSWLQFRDDGTLKRSLKLNVGKRLTSMSRFTPTRRGLLWASWDIGEVDRNGIPLWHARLGQLRAGAALILDRRRLLAMTNQGLLVLDRRILTQKTASQRSAIIERLPVSGDQNRARLIPTPGGGVLVALYNAHRAGGGAQLRLIKLNRQLKVVWQTDVGSVSRQLSARIVPLQGGALIVHTRLDRKLRLRIGRVDKRGRFSCLVPKK